VVIATKSLKIKDMMKSYHHKKELWKKFTIAKRQIVEEMVENTVEKSSR
jgi:hypothetical protein